LYVKLKINKISNLKKLEKKLKKDKIELISKINRTSTLIVFLPKKKLKKISKYKEILWIEELSPPAENKIAYSKKIVNVNPLYTNYYNLTGKGTTTMQYEDGIPYSHIDYDSRASTPQIHFLHSKHATHVAGTIGSDGGSSNNRRIKLRLFFLRKL